MNRQKKKLLLKKVQARADMKEEIVDIAMDVATKIMKKEMNTKENEKLVNEFG